MTQSRSAWGWGLASIDAAGNVLDVWYPKLTLGEAPAAKPNHGFGNLVHEGEDLRGVRRMPVFTVSRLDDPVVDAPDAYLRLHLLSMRLAKTEHAQPRRHLRSAQQRRVDELRPVRRR